MQGKNLTGYLDLLALEDLLGLRGIIDNGNPMIWALWYKSILFCHTAVL